MLYKKILIPIDLHDIQQSLMPIAKDFLASGSQVMFTYITSPLETLHFASNFKNEEKINSQIASVHAEELKNLKSEISKFGFSGHKVTLNTGRPTSKITEMAKENKIDCIVIGSHNSRARKFILGSVANSVVQKAHCDVLIVKP